MNGAASSVVTGVTSGLGRALFSKMAAEGRPVIAVARSGQRSREVLEEVRRESGNGQLHLVEADLSLMSEIAAAARRIDEWAGAEGLQRLVLNAATLTARPVFTAEGWENMFAVNHLGAAVLVLRLESALRRPPNGGHVCAVSSDAHRWVEGLSLEALQEKDPAKRLPAMKTYGATKLAGLVFFAELARRWPEVKVTAHHPGFVSTNLGLHGSWLLRLWWRLSRWRMRDPRVAAAELLAVAKDCPALPGQLSYWEKDRQHDLPAICADAGLAEEVWQLSRLAEGDR